MGILVDAESTVHGLPQATDAASPMPSHDAGALVLWHLKGTPSLQSGLVTCTDPLTWSQGPLKADLCLRKSRSQFTRQHTRAEWIHNFGRLDFNSLQSCFPSVKWVSSKNNLSSHYLHENIYPAGLGCQSQLVTSCHVTTSLILYLFPQYFMLFPNSPW